MKKIKAFTLAEVLVTLAIIGIVAALTIPTVVAKYKKKVVEVQLVKTYNTLFDAIKMSELDNGPIESWLYDDSVSNDFFNKYFSPYIKGTNGSSKQSTLENLGYKNGIRHPDGSVYNTFKADSNRNYIKVNDGSIIFYSDKWISLKNTDNSWSSAVVYYYLIADINGIKEPNMIGKDIFIFGVPAKMVILLECTVNIRELYMRILREYKYQKKQKNK